MCCATSDLQQAVDIGMRARPALCISCMLCENNKTVRRSISIKCTKFLLKILVHGEGALLARLVFDGSNNSARWIDEFDTGQAFD